MKRAADKKAEKTVLVTAFEPFGGRSVNRSQLVLEHIARAAATAKGIRPGVKVVTRLLPVSFAKLGRSLDRALACKPDGIILLGEAGMAQELRLERVAINRIEARIADNEGLQPSGVRVIEEGPAAYFSTLALKGALTSVRRTGTPASLSDDAGSFACNAAYYLALHKLHRRGGDVPPVVFVHVPVRSRTLGLRPATKGVLALVRHVGEKAETSPGRLPRGTAPRKLRATPAGGRKA